MAEGKLTREVVQDRNDNQMQNVPAQRLAVSGISGARNAPASRDNSLTEAIASFGRVGQALTRKQANADLIEGRMASMAGQTQEEVAATGNATTMAGFVSLEVSNAVSAWQQEQEQSATTDHYNTSPEDYRNVLSEHASGLIAQMGGDDVAEEALVQAMAPAMDRLASAQAAAHAQWTQTETVNSYTSSLVLTGQHAASNYAAATDHTAASTSGGDYRAFAQSFSDILIGRESGNNPDARNPNSSAEGYGQFIDSTWLTTVRRYRPDIAGGKTDAELLAMKTNGPLSRQMSVEYAAEQARALASSGLPVTRGNTYLMYFAGPGGGRRVLRGDPDAPVSTTLTQGQINANKNVVYRNGRMITNAELQQWAAGVMGEDSTQATSATGVTREAILTNPGLPPDVHRNAVVDSMLQTLASDDASLFQTAGGIEGLSELNLSGSQIGQITRAHDAMQVRRQSEYNMEYERNRHNILQEAASGQFTEDEMFERLLELQSTNSSSDAEMRRLHSEMQSIIDNAGQTAALDVWQDPERQFDLMQIKNDVLDGNTSAEYAMQEVLQIGEMYGADIEATEQAVEVIMGAYDRVRAGERQEVAAATTAGRKLQETRDRASALISRNVLGTGTAEEQQAGIAVMEETLIEDLQANGTPPNEIAAKSSDIMAKALVQNDVVDTRRASMMRAALSQPLDSDGKPTEDAVEAFAFYLDLKHGANAQPEYLTRMFRGNERTLEMLLTAEEHLVGDADLDMALTRAWAQSQNPVTAARVAERNRQLDTGALQERVKENILTNSGLSDTFWNNTMNLFNSDWADQKIDAEARDRIMSDAGLDLVIEEEVRSAVGLMPYATEDTIAQVVSGQMADRGAVIGSSFVMAPKDTDMRSTMGLNSTDKEAPNAAVIQYVVDHGEKLFGPAVWESLSPTFGDYLSVGRGLATGQTFGEATRSAGVSRPEFVVELIGDNMVIRPASAKYAFDEGLFIDDYAALPEAASAVIPAKDIGRYYNEYQTRPRVGVTDRIVDMFRAPTTEYTPRGQAPQQ